MSFELLVPVDEEVLLPFKSLPKQILGKQILIHTKSEGIPELQGLRMAIVGVHEVRNSYPARLSNDLINFRKVFYEMYPGNWKLNIADLGDLPNGETTEDTYFALKEICLHLRQINILPIIIGGSQDLVYPLYQSFQITEQLVNIVSVDNRFDFSQEDELISGRSYMSKIIMETPNYLNNYSNIGYQSYYCAQEEKDLMEKLYFDSLRLGTILDNVALAEPLLRDADIVGFDMKVLDWQSHGDFENGQPNGIDSRTICSLSRYAGISDRVSLFGLFELPTTTLFNKLLAQIIWYFIEGVNCRFNEYPVAIDDNFVKYTVALSDRSMVFFKSEVSQRWWMEVVNDNEVNNKSKSFALLPCMQNDYDDACRDQIPERWYNAIKRIK